MNKGSKKMAFIISLAIFALVLTLIFFVSKKSGNVSEEKKAPEETEQTVPLPPPSSSSYEWMKKKQENKYQPYKQDQLSYDILKDNPNIVGQAKELMDDFSMSKMEVSSPATTVKLSNGNEAFLLSGCTPHNCSGTAIIIAYDKTANKAYLLTEETSSGEEYKILGNPDDEIRNLLIDYYYNEQ